MESTSLFKILTSAPVERAGRSASTKIWHIYNMPYAANRHVGKFWVRRRPDQINLYSTSSQSSLHFAVGPDTREGCHYISTSQTYLD